MVREPQPPSGARSKPSQGRDQSVVLSTEGLGKQRFHGKVVLLVNEPLGKTTDISLPHTAITEIIMGWKIPTSVRIELLDVVDSIAPDHQLAVSDSKPNRRTWEFSHEPTKYHLCTQCQGRGTTKDKV
jgi:hypothetical protein